MSISDLEEHFEDAERGGEGRPGDPVPDPEQERIQAEREQAEQRKPDGDDEPDARDGAATNPGGAGF